MPTRKQENGPEVEVPDLEATVYVDTTEDPADSDATGQYATVTAYDAADGRFEVTTDDGRQIVPVDWFHP